MSRRESQSRNDWQRRDREPERWLAGASSSSAYPHHPYPPPYYPLPPHYPHYPPPHHYPLPPPSSHHHTQPRREREERGDRGERGDWEREEREREWEREQERSSQWHSPTRSSKSSSSSCSRQKIEEPREEGELGNSPPQSPSSFHPPPPSSRISPHLLPNQPQSQPPLSPSPPPPSQPPPPPQSQPPPPPAPHSDAYSPFDDPPSKPPLQKLLSSTPFFLPPSAPRTLPKPITTSLPKPLLPPSLPRSLPKPITTSLPLLKPSPHSSPTPVSGTERGRRLDGDRLDRDRERKADRVTETEIERELWLDEEAIGEEQYWRRRPGDTFPVEDELPRYPGRVVVGARELPTRALGWRAVCGEASPAATSAHRWSYAVERPSRAPKDPRKRPPVVRRTSRRRAAAEEEPHEQQQPAVVLLARPAAWSRSPERLEGPWDARAFLEAMGMGAHAARFEAMGIRDEHQFRHLDTDYLQSKLAVKDPFHRGLLLGFMALRQLQQPPSAMSGGNKTHYTFCFSGLPASLEHSTLDAELRPFGQVSVGVLQKHLCAATASSSDLAAVRRVYTRLNGHRLPSGETLWVETNPSGHYFQRLADQLEYNLAHPPKQLSSNVEPSLAQPTTPDLPSHDPAFSSCVPSDGQLHALVHRVAALLLDQLRRDALKQSQASFCNIYCNAQIKPVAVKRKVPSAPIDFRKMTEQDLNAIFGSLRFTSRAITPSPSPSSASPASTSDDDDDDDDDDDEEDDDNDDDDEEEEVDDDDDDVEISSLDDDEVDDQGVDEETGPLKIKQLLVRKRSSSAETPLEEVPPAKLARTFASTFDSDFSLIGIDALAAEDYQYLEDVLETGVALDKPPSWDDELLARPAYQRLRGLLPSHEDGCARSVASYRGRISSEQKQLFRELEMMYQQHHARLFSQQVDNPATMLHSDHRDARLKQRDEKKAIQTLRIKSSVMIHDTHNVRQKLVRFARSKIHKYGVVALEEIKAGEFIIQYVGELVRKRVSELREQRYESQGQDSSYLFRLDAHFVIDATYQGNVARFINHSCFPNCKSVTKYEYGQPKGVAIHALRDINKGEELTFDYKFDYEDDRSKAIKCLCGAPNKPGDHFMN